MYRQETSLLPVPQGVITSYSIHYTKLYELFSEREFVALEANTLTFDVRWAGLAPEKDSARFEQTDRALGKLDDFIARLAMRSPEFDDYLRRARIDRLVALRNSYNFV